MNRLKVLIVEDEAATAIMMEEAVELSGHAVAFTASNIRDAMGAAARGDFDVALLDINLNGQKAHAVPVILARAGKPFAFVTGYGETGTLERFADAPVVSKPFRTRDVELVLNLLAARLSGRS